MTDSVTLFAPSLSGIVEAFPSKSELHRVLFCAAFSDGVTHIRCKSLCDDIQATVSVLRTAGAAVEYTDGLLRVTPIDTAIKNDRCLSFMCGESATTARIALALCAALYEGSTVDGADGLRRRPFAALCEAVEAQGAELSCRHLPVTVEKVMTADGWFSVCADISSQYLTALLLILPLTHAKGIRLTGRLCSAGYIDMTVRCMARFGVQVTCRNGRYTCRGSYTAPKQTVDIDGDWSCAAPFICAAALGEKLTITGLPPAPSQPDGRLLSVLQDMGAAFCMDEDGLSFLPRALHGVCFDAADCPDLVPCLCAVAAFCEGDTVIHNTDRLRMKECDRVEAICKMICALGGKASAGNNTVTVKGGGLRGGHVCTCHDHRLVMAAYVCALRCREAVTIDGISAVNKSYPGFCAIFDEKRRDHHGLFL